MGWMGYTDGGQGVVYASVAVGAALVCETANSR